MTSKLKAKNVRHRMPKNKYISLILFALVGITLFNLFYKPNLSDQHQIIQWYEQLVDPVQQTNCPFQGFRCPLNKPCDCETYCSNGESFVPYHVLDKDGVYVMNQKLTPGYYCLPKGVGNCNLKTSYHVFSLAGWACFPLNQAIFKGGKKRACKSEEAVDDSQNFLWDFKEKKEAGDNILDYYELQGDDLRYRCKCGSRALDGTRMISVLPFMCSVDYCLRDIPRPLDFMGWDGEKCACGPYDHEDPNDLQSPCRRDISKVREHLLNGRVDCMNNKSFVKRALYCPTLNSEVNFKEYIYPGRDPTKFVDWLVTKDIDWVNV